VLAGERIMKLDLRPVRFIHVFLAGATLVAMALVAKALGHATAEMMFQDVATVIGTLILTVIYANFKRNTK
jgi:hypothetical protein